MIPPMTAAVTEPSFFPFLARTDETRSRAESPRQKDQPNAAETPKRSRRRFDDIF